MSADKVWQDLSEKNARMLDGDIESDVMFTFPNQHGEDFRQGAHRFVLIRECPVMEAMLCGELKPPCDENGVPQIHLTAVGPKSMKIFLRYLYSRILDVEMEDIIPVLYLSQKYLMDILHEQIIELIKTKITFDNACQILDDAFSYEQTVLFPICLSIIEENAIYVFSGHTFLKLSRGPLKMILDHDTLGVSEIEVVKACQKWAKAQSGDANLDDAGVRQVLGDLFHLIRFPTMKAVDFDAAFWNSNMFDAEEKARLSHCILSKKQDVCALVDGYKDQPRQRGLIRRLFRFEYADPPVEGQPNIEGISEAIDIKVDKSVALLGIGIAGLENQCDHYIALDLYDANAARNIWSPHHTIINISEQEYSSSEEDVFFDKEIVMPPDTWHTVVFKISSPSDLYGTGALRGQSVYDHKCGVKFTFRVTTGTNYYSSLDCGNIANILFQRRDLQQENPTNQ